MKDCREIEMELEAYAGEELDDEARAGVRAHLDGCGSCREELMREENLLLTLRGLPPVTAPKELDSRIRTAIRKEERARSRTWIPGRLTATALLAAASLAVALIVPGLRNTVGPEFSDREIAAGRQDVMYTLALTAKIIDHTRKNTVVDVFADKLPQAINDSFKINKSNTSGGNG